MTQAKNRGGNRKPNRDNDDGERDNLGEEMPPTEAECLGDVLSLVGEVIVHWRRDVLVA